MKGIKYENGQIANNKYERIPEVLKRGLWQYEVSDPKFTEPEVTMDNGMKYNIPYLEKKFQEKE